MSDSSKTVDDVKTLFQSCKGFDSQQTMKFYDSWAQTYEQDIKVIDYRAPRLVVDFLHANFSGSREEVQVLDVACGSGLVAKLMVEVGFRRFVGVDGSKEMLEQAAKTGFYQDLRLALLGTQALPAQTGAFDVVIIVGALGEGYVPVNVVRELCNAAKPGGYVCMSRVDKKSESGNKYKASLERELQLMEEEGLWARVVAEEMNKYMVDVFNENKDEQSEQSEQYVEGKMFLYRKI
ncbi:methyltransferase-like protein 27 [Symphorus nematophorus]